jgi:hypothetical protein
MEAVLQKELVFLFNVYDPSREDAFEKLVSPNYGIRSSRKSGEEKVDDTGAVVVSAVSTAPPVQQAYEWMLNFIKNKVISTPVPPKGSELTSEELVAMGYVGVWEPTLLPNRRCAPMSGAGGLFQTYPKAIKLGADGNWHPYEPIFEKPRWIVNEENSKESL